jgi:hypothetical protein
MLAQILKLRKAVVLGLLAMSSVTLISCATPKETASVVKDPDAHSDSQIPWNRQEKWEVGGPLAGVTDRAQ